jgi:hypothetical protein
MKQPKKLNISKLECHIIELTYNVRSCVAEHVKYAINIHLHLQNYILKNKTKGKCFPLNIKD